MLPLFDVQSKMSELKNWALEGGSLVKNRILNNFKESIAFVEKVANIAEKHNHHPTILIMGDTVRLSLTTISSKGLTQKDFDVAGEIDKL